MPMRWWEGKTAPRIAVTCLNARIRPTCEVVLTESPAHLQKFLDPESGIAVIKPQALGSSAGSQAR
jgi:hypothetical protein